MTPPPACEEERVMRSGTYPGRDADEAFAKRLGVDGGVEGMMDLFARDSSRGRDIARGYWGQVR